MTVLYIILGIIGLLLLVAAILPSQYLIEKSILINRPAVEVYNQVANLQHYREWNPWQKQDPAALATITGDTGHIGHKYHWTGKKIGEGHLTIRSVTPGKAINFDLEFIKPWKSRAMDAWDFTETNEGTKAVWRNSGNLSYPIARLMGPFIDKQLNQHFEAGLKSLKEACEY